MKKILYIFIAFAAVAVCACNKEKADAPIQEVQLTFTASWGDEALPTKTMLDTLDNTKVLWSPDEFIKVFSGNMAGVFYSINARPSRTIEMRGGLVPLNGATTGSVSGTYWAVYPSNIAQSCNNDQSVTLTVPSSQTGAEETFAQNMAPAVAVSNNFHFTFYNVCGGIRFTVNEPGIKIVQFGSVDGEALSGNVTVGKNPTTQLPTVLTVNSGIPYVSVTAPDSTFVPGHHYFAMMLPTQPLANGLTVQCIKTSGSGSRVVNSTKGKQVIRSRFGTLDQVDNGVWSATPATPEYVDLGVNVYWATFNLGANSPEGFGAYYAWGETDPKDTYTWENYKWGTQYHLTKYCQNSQFGTPDGKSELDSEDDAATVAWGSAWRTPTNWDWNELFNNCSWESTHLNGIPVYKVTSKKTGYTDKFIYLPVTGAWDAYMAAAMGGEMIVSYNSNDGYYQSRTCSYDSYNCYYFRLSAFSSSSYYNEYRYRYLPASIRPVRNKYY